MTNQSNRTAVITGAGDGIGRALAINLNSCGIDLYLCDIDRERLDATAGMLNSDGVTVSTAVVDCGNREQIETWAAMICAENDSLDFLFNNAGVSTPAIPLPELSLEMWKGVVDTNLTGMFLCIREAFRVMKDQKPMGGRIINNGSISATTPRPFSIAYTSTKHAVSGLTKTASLDGRQYDIAVGQIDVGNAATPMAMRMAKGVPQANLEIKYTALIY